jgi:hypothetical protein
LRNAGSPSTYILNAAMLKTLLSAAGVVVACCAVGAACCAAGLCC